MPNIVVVDDDITNVQLLQMLLELDGFTVHASTNLEQALAMTTADTNAFVVDWHLERNTSGLDLLRAVRQGETAAQKDTAVIISSGDHRREQDALDAGANHFMLKPYPPDELSKLLASLLSS
ncbi:MAG TPA: response regulator [Chloroflexota bacterium]|nr:response regulator [Chloroflexota bacterium]HUM71070.1 response regulator [Chloroflexota bacterium]